MRKQSTANNNDWRSILKFSHIKVNQSTIRRAYNAWRQEQGIPTRCDNVDCQFYTNPLMWNGKPLSVILDHREGNRHDNSPANLRYLCPICDSQLPTRGGANRGRVQNLTEDGYTLMNRDGTKIVAATAQPARGTSSASAVGSSMQEAKS